MAVKPDDGKPGAIVRAALEGVLREQNLWDDARQAHLEELNRKLIQGERTLATGGIRLSEARELAVQMRRDRYELRVLLGDRNSLDVNTAEAQAENARFNSMVASCTVHADTGKPYWKSEEDYLASEEHELAGKAARIMGNLVYDLDDDFELKLPEARFLIARGFADAKGHLIDKRGRLIDSLGRLVNEDGRLVNEEGQLVDVDGNLLTDDGKPKVDFVPFLDEDGLPIPEPGEAAAETPALAKADPVAEAAEESY